ncbi:MAG: crotonase/enoyl-CoA hydratase family protein [Myxococcota bacterium]
MITTVVDGAVARIELANPAKLNALGPEFWTEFPEALARVDADPAVRCVVLTGEGKAFTAGLDLQRMVPQIPLSVGAADGSATWRLHELIRRLQAAVTAAERCRVPVIAAVHGYCIGGGIDLITACDLRLCAADARFSVRETRLAMVADLGTLQRLPAIVGPGRARELVFTGRDFGADEALAYGLVEEVLPDRDALVTRAMALAATIAHNPPLTVQGAKRVLVEADRARVDRGLEYVATWNAAHLDTQDLREAIAAAAERRPPGFQGR